MSDAWRKQILARFEGREILSRSVLFEKFFKRLGLRESEVMECFDEIERDYSIPVGILRPDDSITKLTDPIPTNNPFRWFSWQPRSEFTHSELMIELGIKLKQHGTGRDWKFIDTFDDFVRAWCGQRPEPTKIE